MASPARGRPSLSASKGWLSTPESVVGRVGDGKEKPVFFVTDLCLIHVVPYTSDFGRRVFVALSTLTRPPLPRLGAGGSAMIEIALICNTAGVHGAGPTRA